MGGKMPIIRLAPNFLLPSMASMEEKIIISGIRLDLTEAIRNYVKGKMVHILGHDPSIIRIHVDLEWECHRSHVDNFKVMGRIEGGPRGEPPVARAEGDDLYGAIDLLESRLDRQLCSRLSQEISSRHG
jgi:putative sigma-54 modulation protein